MTQSEKYICPGCSLHVANCQCDPQGVVFRAFQAPSPKPAEGEALQVLAEVNETLFENKKAVIRSLSRRVEELEKGLLWALDEIADRDEDETPKHECEFVTNPLAGYCEFHDRYWQYHFLLGTTKEGE